MDFLDDPWADLWWSTNPKRLLKQELRWFDRVIKSSLTYLTRTQRPDGSWLPLWFGNQHAADEANPVYGTARVLAAYRDLSIMDTEPARRGVGYLLSVQNPDGGWGGDRGCPSSVEETSLAVEVLLDVPHAQKRVFEPLGSERSESAAQERRRFEDSPPGVRVEDAVNRGLNWLIQAVDQGRLKSPEPIGFYFAKLWYYEKLYPIIFAVGALGRARRKLTEHRDGEPGA